MNDKEWRYVSEVARKLGGDGKVPGEMRGRDCREVIKSMAEGYIFTARVTAEPRGRELPFWRRKTLKKQFIEMAEKRAAQLLAEADLWLTTDFFELAKTGMPQSVQAAISRGADLNARNDRGWTPLMCASGFNQNPEAIRALLQAGADINAKVAYEPMMLIQYAPDVSPDVIKADRANCWTPLMCAAVFNQNPDVITILLKAGADVNARDNNGRTLQQAGADNNAKVVSGLTVLMLAAKHNQNPAVITTLLKAGADIKGRDTSGWTPLMHAARDNPNHEVIRKLIEAGAEVNARNVFGGTALKLAADFNQKNPAVIMTLLKAGAEGKTAFDCAEK